MEPIFKIQVSFTPKEQIYYVLFSTADATSKPERD